MQASRPSESTAWLRKTTSPVQEFLAEEGLPPIGGSSVLYDTPFIEEDIHTAKAGRLQL